MPELSRFYGIVIRMHFREHGPPHFHADYGGVQALIEIGNLTVLSGKLPSRALGLVREWAALHQEELRLAWERAMRHESPGKIEPLE